MAQIAPFRGFFYNPDRITDLSRVVTPPYDVIDPNDQDRYYAQNPYNIIRLDFGKQFPEDTPGNNRYTRAAQVLRIWEKEGILIRDQAPAIYLYKAHFQIPGQGLRVRTGFISLLKLEPFESGRVRPHEKTFSSFKLDRYQLLQACRMQYCPIFSFYLDPENKILSTLVQAGNTPFIDFTDQEFIRHQLWRISDSSILEKVRKTFDGKTVYIADGHHRYETGLAYQADLLKKFPHSGPDAPFNFTLMFLCPMEDPGLTIFPVHRILNQYSEIEPALLEKKLGVYFEIEKMSFTPGDKKEVTRNFLSRLEKGGKEGMIFGLFMTGISWFYLLTLKEEGINQTWGEDLPPLLKKLDVQILSHLVFQKIFGMRSEELDQENRIEYHHDALQTLELVEQGRNKIGFLLAPTPIEQIKEVAEASLVMPRKSTYFYPKTLTGLVMNSLE
jgi:uncharacterized protein (DUF1015 family)